MFWAKTEFLFLKQSLKEDKNVATGFTLIEMLVVIAIAGIITAAVLGNYPEFSRRLDIEREAQLMALALREAEERAIRTSLAGSAFTVPFGVHFDVGQPRQYILFADADGDNFYDSGEDIETMSIGRGVRIKSAGQGLCQFEKQTSGTNCNINSLSITFKRPAPLIEVRGKTTTSGGSVVDLGEPDFEIHVETADSSHEQTIVVWTTGAISIED